MKIVSFHNVNTNIDGNSSPIIFFFVLLINHVLSISLKKRSQSNHLLLSPTSVQRRSRRNARLNVPSNDVADTSTAKAPERSPFKARARASRIRHFSRSLSESSTAFCVPANRLSGRVVPLRPCFEERGKEEGVGRFIKERMGTKRRKWYSGNMKEMRN